LDCHPERERVGPIERAQLRAKGLGGAYTGPRPFARRRALDSRGPGAALLRTWRRL